jgi:hypothetical protein
MCVHMQTLEQAAAATAPPEHVLRFPHCTGLRPVVLLSHEAASHEPPVPFQEQLFVRGLAATLQANATLSDAPLEVRGASQAPLAQCGPAVPALVRRACLQPRCGAPAGSCSSGVPSSLIFSGPHCSPAPTRTTTAWRGALHQSPQLALRRPHHTLCVPLRLQA